MGTDTSISLGIGGDHFHILCDDPDALARIAEFSRPWHAAPAALPGFQVAPPTAGKRLWVLLGSNGAVLARSTDRDDILRCLERHLHALASDRPNDSSRFSLTAIAGPNGIALVHPDLFRYQPFIERRWAQAGMAIVDSVFASLQLNSSQLNSPHLASPPMSIGSAPTSPDLINGLLGHIDSSLVNRPVLGLLWTGHYDAPEATHAQIVHALTTSSLADSQGERLRTAHEWAPHLPIVLVPALERKSLLEAAKALLCEVDAASQLRR